jgi:hypothetical protein
MAPASRRVRQAPSGLQHAVVRLHRDRTLFDARRKGFQQVRGYLRIGVHDGDGIGPRVIAAALKAELQGIALAAQRRVAPLEHGGAGRAASAAVASVQLSAITRMR